MQEIPKLYVIEAGGRFYKGGACLGRWTERLNDARWYQKLGSARSKVTALFQLGRPADILEFSLHSPRKLDEGDRVQKSVAAKARAQASREAMRKKLELQFAQQNLQAAQARLQQLGGKA